MSSSPATEGTRPCGTLWFAGLLAAAVALGVILRDCLGVWLYSVAWVVLVVSAGLCVYLIARGYCRRPQRERTDSVFQRTPERVDVIESGRVFDQFFKVDSARLRFERYDGTMSEPVTRLVFERGDAVSVLPYDPVRRELVLVQQFRYPAWTRNPADAWMWEAIAGMIEEGQSIEETARREALEEAGYTLGEVRHVATVYTSPGGTSERLHILVAPITDLSRTEDGGGLEIENEDIRVCTFSLERALDMLEAGEIVNAITVLTLQYVALHQEQLFGR